MDELQVISENRPCVPPPKHARLMAARARLVAGIKDSAGTGVRDSARARRWIVAGGIGIGVAAVAAAWLVPLLPSGAGTPPAPVALPGRTSIHSPVHLVSATDVLHDAAAAALKEPDIVPRADQFVYRRYADGRQVWLSVDGSQNGLVDNPDGTETVVSSCHGGQAPGLGKQGNPIAGRAQQCGTYTLAYDPSLPTDPQSLLQYLNDGMPYDPSQPGDVNRVGKGVMELMSGSYLRPAVRAALFDAVAQIPGLHVVSDATDGLGRHGVGISWSYSGSNELVFDSTTYAFLGVTTTSAGGDTGSSSVAQIAIVNQAGEAPAN